MLTSLSPASLFNTLLLSVWLNIWGFVLWVWMHPKYKYDDDLLFYVCIYATQRPESHCTGFTLQCFWPNQSSICNSVLWSYLVSIADVAFHMRARLSMASWTCSNFCTLHPKRELGFTEVSWYGEVLVYLNSYFYFLWFLHTMSESSKAHFQYLSQHYKY